MTTSYQPPTIDRYLDEQQATIDENRETPAMITLSGSKPNGRQWATQRRYMSPYDVRDFILANYRRRTDARVEQDGQELGRCWQTYDGAWLYWYEDES